MKENILVQKNSCGPLKCAPNVVRSLILMHLHHMESKQGTTRVSFVTFYKKTFMSYLPLMHRNMVDGGESDSFIIPVRIAPRLYISLIFYD